MTENKIAKELNALLKATKNDTELIKKAKKKIEALELENNTLRTKLVEAYAIIILSNQQKD